MRNLMLAIISATCVGCATDAIRPIQATDDDFNFHAYFDTDSARLNAASRDVARYMLKNCRSIGSQKIRLSGHTDTVGSAPHNSELSLRRAEAIKQALVGMGVPAENISTVGLGASQLAIQTGDGVNELRNRRVVFTCH